MARITTDEEVHVVRTSHELISKEKCLVKLEPGCIWSRILDDGESVGLVFNGPAKYIVDAIVETDRGAVGQSVSGSLKGIQIYFGTGRLDEISHSASGSDLQSLGYSSEEDFLDIVKTELNDLGAANHESRGSIREGNVLIGTNQADEKIVLVAKEAEIVLTHDESVLVVEGDKLVSVDKEGVSVTESTGKTITVGKNGIGGIDIPGLKGLGQGLSTLIGESMMGLKGLKGLKSLKKLHSREVDDLDWDDKE